jgi:hypothetical protein
MSVRAALSRDQISLPATSVRDEIGLLGVATAKHKRTILPLQLGFLICRILGKKAQQRIGMQKTDECPEITTL